MPGLTIVLLGLLASSLVADERTAIRFDVRVAGGGTPPAITLTSVSDPAVVRQLAWVEGGGSLSEAAGSEWEVGVPPGFWMPATRIAFPSSGTVTTSLAVWRTGIVRGQLAVTGAPRPASIALVTEAAVAGVSPAIAQGTSFPCAVEDTGRFTCTLPATKLNLVARATALTPRYLWDVDVAADATKDLGRIAMQPGASFSARLERTVLGQLKTPARARLLRPVSDLPSDNTARLSVPVAEGEFDARGFIQLAPLPPGTYVLDVVAKGFAPARIGPVEIYDGKETAYRKLIELFPPVQVTIAVDPPADTDARPWTIELEPASGAATAIVAQTDSAGNAVLADQSPGLFFLGVRDAERNKLHDEQLQLDRRDLHIPIHLDLHFADGTVSLGDTALPKATIWFGTAHGAMKVRATTDDEGRFRARLPHLGAWPVEIVSDSPPAHAIVQVDAGEEHDLDIRLPDTQITGWVVDTNGQHLTRGSVTVMAGKHAIEVKLNENGEFAVRGVAAGRVHLHARDMRGGSSAIVPLEVRGDQPLRDVELRIVPERTFAGRVTSAGRPAAGAIVQVAPQGIGASSERVVTDLEGRFDVDVPAEATRALVVIGAPARTMEAFDVVLSDQQHAFDVAPAGGTIEITGSMLGSPPFVLTRNGVLLPVHALIDWILAHGQPVDDQTRLRIPDLSPGQYRLCARAQCVDGELAPGATLVLAIPNGD